LAKDKFQPSLFFLTPGTFLWKYFLMANGVTIIGGGLAGCEAAWQAAQRGISVDLHEMKPLRFSPAHVSDHLAELVCSNSLRSNNPHNAVGLLKEELRRLNSLIMKVADETRVPAGDALAVDRRIFAEKITGRLATHGQIRIFRKEVTQVSEEGILILASGPLTSPPLAESIRELTGTDSLYFYDAIAPIIDGDSLNSSTVFRASRYGEGDDYVNCPMNRDEYYRFIEELKKGEKIPYRDFENPVHFEGCLPIEEMADRGIETLAHGPMKPVGLIDPHTGRMPYAVVQLRRENAEGSAFNLVGFQTKLKWKEQERIFRLIPGLEKASFLRFGSMHRNTFIHSPALLTTTLQLKREPRIFFAGQITGVEGYVESTAMGLLAGVNASFLAQLKPLVVPPETTAMGGLVRHLTRRPERGFQPMNVNFGILPSPSGRLRGRDKHKAIAARALNDLEEWIRLHGLTLPANGPRSKDYPENISEHPHGSDSGRET
jgi:methylenetetrahydrofolate--tRNA-(uracil-5-)-methyltransferase